MADPRAREPDAFRQAREARADSARLCGEAYATQREAARLTITSVRLVGEATILLLEGELEMASTPIVLTEVEALGDGDLPLRIDLSGIDFMDSTGLRLLLQMTAPDFARRSTTLIRTSEAVMRVVAIPGTGERLGLADA